ncbi:MAG TPA: metallophosphoesterase family protein [Candidatus Dormibacteraeota bacterium]|nr:metallophosphoesterase family protein [Candidatus Dormibacteraeota bacterium]
MRYAILSDIHGNLEALEAVLASLSPGDQLLCLGDVVGYGPNPNECAQLLRERDVRCVLGNHDVAAIDNFGVEYFNPIARQAIVWTQDVIDPPTRDWLGSLDYELHVEDFLMVHGSPERYFEYILDDAAAGRAFAATDAPLIFIGHSHIAEYYQQRPDGRIAHGALTQGGEVALLPGHRYIVNVGSVGQPRDFNPAASFGFYDPEQRVVNVVRVPYEIERVQRKIHACRLPEQLAQRLTLGR